MRRDIQSHYSRRGSGRLIPRRRVWCNRQDSGDLAFPAWNFNASGAVSFHLRIAAPNPAETLSAGEEPAANYERKARQFSRDRFGRRCDRRGALLWA
jgi:hypothetical protein